jgi:organic radical activating enzyme
MEENMNDEIYLSRMNIFVTFRCTLKCHLCVNGVQYFPPGEDLKLEMFSSELKTIYGSEIPFVDRVRMFTFTGGEPFMRADLGDFVREAAKYKQFFESIKIDTNGTLPMNDRLINALKEHNDKCFVFISNYGEILSKNVDSIVTDCEKNNIRYDVRKYYGDDMYFNGWVNDGDYNCRNRTPNELEQVFKNCGTYTGLKGGWGLLKGQLHFCCRSVRGTIEGVIASERNIDYLDIFDESTSTEQKRQIIRNMQNPKYIAACNYCDGQLGTDDITKRFKPAEQGAKK